MLKIIEDLANLEQILTYNCKPINKQTYVVRQNKSEVPVCD